MSILIVKLFDNLKITMVCYFLDWGLVTRVGFLPSFRAAKLAPEQKSTIGRGGLGFGLVASTPLGGIAIITTNQIRRFQILKILNFDWLTNEI